MIKEFKLKKLLFVLIVSISYAQVVVSQRTYVPDDQFEDNLIRLGYDNQMDNYVNTSSISTVTSLFLAGQFIYDLTGINDFASLQSLSCNSNYITTLTINGLSNLRTLNCDDNQLVRLELNNMTSLTSLSCVNNKLTELRVGSFTGLSQLYCNTNRLTNLDLTGLSALTRLTCASNQLLGLDISHISTLTSFDARNNPYFNCIKVSNVSSASSNANWLKDASASYATNCSLSQYQVTYVPNDNFESELIRLGYDNTLDNYVLNANIRNVAQLNFSNVGINNLTGIQGFTSLENLNVGPATLTGVDLSKNTKLKYLEIYGVGLRSLNLTNNTLLGFLECGGNPFTSIDLSKNVALYELRMNESKVTNLNLSTNTALITLLSYNLNAGGTLTTIDLRNSKKLDFVDAQNNSLTSVLLPQNVTVSSIRLSNNRLTNIDLSSVKIKTELTLNNNRLINLDIRGNSTMPNLNVRGNANLRCIYVDNETLANSNTNWLKDATAVFSSTCITTIGDEDFNSIKTNIFPNPAMESIEVEGLDDGSVVYLLNIWGKELQNKVSKNKTTFDLSALPAGEYIVKSISDSKTSVQKFIKQ